MMEQPIGEEITLADKRKVQVVEGNACRCGCVFFDAKRLSCSRPIGFGFCSRDNRSDRKQIIYKEIKDNG